MSRAKLTRKGSGEDVGEFVIAGRDCPESFEFAKESFDQIRFAVERDVGSTLDRLPRRDLDDQLSDVLALEEIRKCAG